MASSNSCTEEPQVVPGRKTWNLKEEQSYKVQVLLWKEEEDLKEGDFKGFFSGNRLSNWPVTASASISLYVQQSNGQVPFGCSLVFNGPHFNPVLIFLPSSGAALTLPSPGTSICAV